MPSLNSRSLLSSLNEHLFILHLAVPPALAANEADIFRRTGQRPRPVPVESRPANLVAVEGGARSGCGRDRRADLVSWGRNRVGTPEGVLIRLRGAARVANRGGVGQSRRRAERDG